VLYAFQPEEVRRRWEAQLVPALSDEAMARLRGHADEVRGRQVETTPSTYVAGVTDISAPVLRGGAATAALTVPYLERREPLHPVEDVTRMLLAAAAAIADQLVASDERI
jgi:DNA-binding IclR family transcriptional regulator